LQLDELRFAKRSPRRAAVEYHHGASVTTRLMQMHGLSILVRQHDVGKTFPYGRANGAEVDAKVCHCSHRSSLSLSIVSGSFMDTLMLQVL